MDAGATARAVRGDDKNRNVEQGQEHDRDHGLRVVLAQQRRAGVLVRARVLRSWQLVGGALKPPLAPGKEMSRNGCESSKISNNSDFSQGFRLVTLRV